MLPLFLRCDRLLSSMREGIWLRSKHDAVLREQQGIEQRFDSKGFPQSLPPLSAKQKRRNGQSKRKPACGKVGILKQRKRKSIQLQISLTDISAKYKNKILNIL